MKPYYLHILRKVPIIDLYRLSTICERIKFWNTSTLISGCSALVPAGFMKNVLKIVCSDSGEEKLCPLCLATNCVGPSRLFPTYFNLCAIINVFNCAHYIFLYLWCSMISIIECV